MSSNTHHLRGLSAEQVLLIADELCARFPDSIRDYSALAAIAAATTARFRGIPVHKDPESQASYAYQCILKLQPLGSRNDLFAATVKKTLLNLNADFHL